MKTNYSEAFVEQAVIKLLTRGKRTIREVALELNVNYQTARNWTKKGAANKAVVSEPKEKRPQDWSSSEQLQALNETHALSGEALQTWCRERGLFAHHLSSWKTVFCAPAKALADTGPWRSLKNENEQLRRELLRKEKALSEAAALLMLQKKFRALWEDEVK